MAKDTPNFIGNRIGTFSVLNVMRLMQEMDLSIEEVDALTGQAVGWPKSATFRTIDLVGLDILGHVVGNMTANVRDERSDLKLPEFFGQDAAAEVAGRQNQGWLLQKSKRRRGQRGRAAGARLEDAGISSAAEAQVPCARHGEERRRHGRACANASRYGWQRSAEGRQGRSIPVVGTVRSVDLLRQSCAGDFRLDR